MTAPRRTAMEYAAFLLGRRALSTAQLRKKLLAKAYGAAEIRETIEDFTRHGYLNDAVHAEALCEALSERGAGKRQIGAKLRARGINPEIIAATLAKLDESAPEEAAAFQALCRKKSALLREPDARKRKVKAVRFLASHGFSAAAAFAAWNRFRGSEDA